MSRLARVSHRCQWRWLFADSPTDLRKPSRANATEPHLWIPAEYHRRPREQREMGDSGGDRYEGCFAQGGYGRSAAGGEEGKRRRGSEVKRSSKDRTKEGASPRAFLRTRSPMSSTPILTSSSRIVAPSLSADPSRLSPPPVVPELL